jgi:hypothetical protein
MLGGDEAAASLRVGGGRRDLPILQRRVGAGTRAAATMTSVMSSHTRSTATVSIATTARDLASPTTGHGGCQQQWWIWRVVAVGLEGHRWLQICLAQVSPIHPVSLCWIQGLPSLSFIFNLLFLW